jgi:preprotein translocase subunit YajC
MDFLISTAMAQAAAGGPPPQPSLFTTMLPLLLFAVFAYFLLIRPQSKRAKEHRAMIAALAKGDEVIVAQGILGRVEEVAEATVTVEIAEGVTIKVQKHAVGMVLPKGTLKSN